MVREIRQDFFVFYIRIQKIYDFPNYTKTKICRQRNVYLICKKEENELIAKVKEMLDKGDELETYDIMAREA